MQSLWKIIFAICAINDLWSIWRTFTWREFLKCQEVLGVIEFLGNLSNHFKKRWKYLWNFFLILYDLWSIWRAFIRMREFQKYQEGSQVWLNSLEICVEKCPILLSMTFEFVWRSFTLGEFHKCQDGWMGTSNEIYFVYGTSDFCCSLLLNIHATQ